MFNPIDLAFQKAKKENRPALLTYTVAGDSSKNQSLLILKAISKYADIVYEDVVQRTSDWTFMDLHSVNFIVEYSTDNIYAIDFQSYTYIPNHEERISRWNSCKDHDASLVHNLYGI